MKKCTKCKEYKNYELFYKHKRNKDGLTFNCKACCAEYQRRNKDSINLKTAKWRNKNKEKHNQAVRNWRLNNPEKQKQSCKNWRMKNKNYFKLRRLNDINYRLACNIRRRVHHILNGKLKVESSIKALGCNIQELKLHLEKQFKNEMTWDNYGEWHIDHIKPLSLFDLTDKQQFLEACHYTNLQPLWALDNIKKSNNFTSIGV